MDTPSLLLTLRVSAEIDLRHAQRNQRRRLLDLALGLSLAALFATWAPAPASLASMLFEGVFTVYLAGFLCVTVFRLAFAKDAVRRCATLRADLRAYSRKVWMGNESPTELTALRKRIEAGLSAGAPVDLDVREQIEEEIADERAVFLPPKELIP